MRNRTSTRDLTMMALMTALLCVSSYLVIPLPFSAVSMTAQTFVVNMIALLFSPKKAGMIVLVWILLGAAGIPVFSGGMGGLGRLFGPTGGYIVGYAAAAVVISFLKGSTRNVFRYTFVTVFAGIFVIDLMGMLWYWYSTGSENMKAVITAAVLPFLPLDIGKCLLAVMMTKYIRRIT